jgi:hypothetical protein
VGTIDFAESTALNEAGSEAFVTVVLMHSLTVSGAETIRLTCTAPFSGQAFAQFAAFDAYRLGGIQ